jgi:hypothetical protein
VQKSRDLLQTLLPRDSWIGRSLSRIVLRLARRLVLPSTSFCILLHLGFCISPPASRLLPTFGIVKEQAGCSNCTGHNVRILPQPDANRALGSSTQSCLRQTLRKMVPGSSWVIESHSKRGHVGSIVFCIRRKEEYTLGPRQLDISPSTSRSQFAVLLICFSSDPQVLDRTQRLFLRPGTSTSHVRETGPRALTRAATAQRSE